MNIDPQNVEISMNNQYIPLENISEDIEINTMPKTEDKVEFQHKMYIAVKNPSEANNYLYKSYKSRKYVKQFKYGKLELPINNTDYLQILVSEINNKTRGQTDYTVNIVTYYGSDTFRYINRFFEENYEN